MHRLRTVPAVVVAVVLLAGCAPEPGASAGSPSASVPMQSLNPTPSPSPTSAPTPRPTDSPAADAVPACWHVAVPGVLVASSETPEEFAEANPGLVQSGAPSPCSLVAAGTHREEAVAWLDGLIADGWAADDLIEDDVYSSRLAHSSDGWTAGYLVSQPGTSAAPITQFQLYRK